MKKELVIKIKQDEDLFYEDITSKMLQEANPNSIEPKEVFEYAKINVDGSITEYNISNAKFDPKGPSLDELASIKTLREKLGWNIHILHRVNENAVSTPDIRNLKENLEYWDIKGIHKADTIKSKANKLSHAINGAKRQTTNVVIDLNRADCDLSNDDALEQLNNIFKNKTYNTWLEQVVLIGKNDFIKYFKKKKRTALDDDISFSS